MPLRWPPQRLRELVSSLNIFPLLAMLTPYRTQALTRRKAIFEKFKLPTTIFEGRVNALWPLRDDGNTGNRYGIVFSPTLGKVVVGKGVPSFIASDINAQLTLFYSNSCYILLKVSG